jgi:glycosyltransferase involved in cell wall biosynthesis
VERLGKHLASLLGDEAARKQMGAQGRSFALARFDAKVMVDALERVYEQCLRQVHR